MKFLWLFLFIALFACSPQGESSGNKETNAYLLAGNWHFLDKYGNYNEAYFTDSTYVSINRFMNQEAVLPYYLRKDSLYSNLSRSKGGMRPIAGIRWIDEDHVVISTEFVRDTLARMTGVGVTIANTNPKSDSLKFYTAFYTRYEAFLISRGIITEEEVKAFRENQKVPEDVLNKKQKR